MDRPRCAIVGAGLMGRWHADAALRAGAEIAFIVDSDIERARRLARNLRVRNCETVASLESALTSDLIRIVHVCTPLHTHATLARRALESGRHVLVEKPLAESAGATHELLASAAQRNLLVCPVHQLLFQRGVLRAGVMAKGLGTVLHFDAVACSAGAEGRSGTDRDAVAVDILPHAFALVERFVGCSAGDVPWSVLRERPGELRVCGALGQVSMSILVSMAGRPTKNEMTVTCTLGTIHLDLYHGFAVIDRGSVSRAQKIARPFRLSAARFASAALNLGARTVLREPAYPGLRELVRRFYAAAARGETSPIPPHEVLSVARARDQVLRAVARLPE